MLDLGLKGFGIAHLTVACEAFRAQVPEHLAGISPAGTGDIVLGSGIIAIGLGAALVMLPEERRRIGMAVAAYFAAIVPGNIPQLLTRSDPFGLDTDRKRVARLFLRPLFVLWALSAGEII